MGEEKIKILVAEAEQAPKILILVLVVKIIDEKELSKSGTGIAGDAGGVEVGVVVVLLSSWGGTKGSVVVVEVVEVGSLLFVVVGMLLPLPLSF